MRNMDEIKRDDAIIGTTQVIKALYEQGHKIIERGTIRVDDGGLEAPPNAKTALVIYFS